MKLQDLNPPQRRAVQCIDRPCLVLAGAGSGKTRVIARKIAWLLEQGYRPGQVCALTFTNKAAREMQQRCRPPGRKGSGSGPRISTFHTLGLGILQREAGHLGYRRGFSIMDARDAETCLGQLAWREVADADNLRRARHRISRWKNDFIDPAAAAAAAEDDLDAAFARLYAEYQQQLQACNAMDFDDLIGLPVRLFRAETEVLHRWQNRIRYLLVDEYQDTSTSQYELIRLLCRAGNGLTVVGDDDQSIYAWRGARPENIRLLLDDFPDLEVIKLEQNYRSSGRILRAANHLIANNDHLFDKQLWSARGDGDPIRVMPCRNGDDEASRIAVDILARAMHEALPLRRIAILYRSNFQSRVYEKALRDHSIPYQVSGGQAFFERREIKDILAYLRLTVNPDDDPALLRIVNTPRREIGASTIRALAGYAAERHRSLGAALGEIGLRERLDRRAWLRLQTFAELIAELRIAAGQADAMTFCRELIAHLDYREWLDETSGSRKQAEAAYENLDELISWIGNLQASRDDTGLEATLSHLSLMSILDSQNAKQEQEAVQLMTLHASKGLEFAKVYLAGFEDDCLPHHHSRDAVAIAEERRLAYVGITRAESGLTLSYAKTRQRYGELQSCDPSRFLYELPEADLDGAEHTASRLSDDEREQRDLARFADLKALLGTAD